MERPLKRMRLSTAAAYDEIPDIDKVRQKNDLRLRGRFEAIFDKYNRDFTGIADEIDLESGKVVVDNGHLSAMRHDLDTHGGATRNAVVRMPARTQALQNNEKDELSTPARPVESTTVSTLKDNQEYSTITPAGLAGHIASAVSAQQTPFNPFDPASIAELGKNIALQLAQIMRGTFPSNPHQQSVVHAIGQVPEQVMTPPGSDREIRDIHMGRPSPLQRARGETPHMRRDQEEYSHRSRPRSVWARSHSLSPAPSCLPIPSVDLPYTTEENTKLTRLKHHKKAWHRIAEEFPDRTLASLQNHWSELLRIQIAESPGYSPPETRINTRPKSWLWSEEDTNKLHNLGMQQKCTMSEISSEFPGRTRKALERKLEHLRAFGTDDQACAPRVNRSNLESKRQRQSLPTTTFVETKGAGREVVSSPARSIQPTSARRSRPPTVAREQAPAPSAPNHGLRSSTTNTHDFLELPRQTRSKRHVSQDHGDEQVPIDFQHPPVNIAPLRKTSERRRSGRSGLLAMKLHAHSSTTNHTEGIGSSRLLDTSEHMKAFPRDAVRVSHTDLAVDTSELPADSPAAVARRKIRRSGIAVVIESQTSVPKAKPPPRSSLVGKRVLQDDLGSDDELGS